MPVSKETTGGSLPLFFFFKLNLFGLDDFFFHPFLSALSSGRERNILMKPLLSSYHFDPLVFSPVYTSASRKKGFRVSPSPY